MTPDPTEFPFGALGPPPDPSPPAVGSFVLGRPDQPRQPVRWLDQFRDHHELADHVDPDREAYLSLYHYPAGPYCAHFTAAGYSPRGYSGPAGCRALLLDIDRPGDPDRALADTRTLVRHLLGRYGPKLDDGLAVYFSGGKGFHVTAELLPGFAPSPAVPAVCKRLALAIVAAAGVRVDTGCYDHQRLVRLPNTRHPATGLYKRLLTHEELFALDAGGVAELARHPAGFPVPTAGEFAQELQDDWDRAAEAPSRSAIPSAGGTPTVPKFVRDFIGWQDVRDPGRAVTLFRCAAALAEAGTPEAVVFGLLEEPAFKSGLPPAEVRRQIAAGAVHGRRRPKEGGRP